MIRLIEFLRWIPGYATFRHYQRAWLGHDVFAGLSLAAVLVPAGMAYASASGLPPITGIYATIGPLVVYALIGPSRILVLGPDSALVALISSTVLPLAAGDARRAVSLAALLALLVGVTCVLGSAARLGRIADFVSGPMRYGYVNGLAVTVIASQLSELFGFSISGGDLVKDVTDFIQGLTHGATVTAALLIGASSLALIVILRWRAPRVPGTLIATVLATAGVAWLGLGQEVQVVGEIPKGLPVPALPDVNVSDAIGLVPAAFAIALLSFTDTVMISRTFAARRGYDAKPNHELVALGVADLAAGVVGGFPISSSGTRTPVAEAAGARTQLAGLVAATVLAALLLTGPGLVRDLPIAALAAVVIAAAAGLVEVRKPARLWRIDRPELLLSVATFLGVAFLGVLPGMAVAIGLSLLDFIRHSWRPHDAVLGRVEGMKGYHDLERHPQARQVPGLLLYRWDAPLFFANAEYFRSRVHQAMRERDIPVRWVVVASEPITDIDSTAYDVLETLQRELRDEGTELAFAELKGPVKDRVSRYGLRPARFFPTIGAAVKEYVRETGVVWRDWEERNVADGAQ